MVGFSTKNSVYHVDPRKKTISGGVLGRKKVSFSKAVVLVGLPAEIQLTDGKVMRTSTVTAVRSFV